MLNKLIRPSMNDGIESDLNCFGSCQHRCQDRRYPISSSKFSTDENHEPKQPVILSKSNDPTCMLTRLYVTRLSNLQSRAYIEVTKINKGCTDQGYN